ncbi:MAG: tRNA(Ile)(2)-agmatinylcytidine synthase [Candidatus Bathyarchaeota archaeon]
MLTQLHIGIDDTDSPTSGCTTYIGALLVEEFRKRDLTFIDYPNLVRLNPNIPWKTRGNGAICLRLRLDKDEIKNVKELTIKCVEKNSDLRSTRTDPGIAFLEGKPHDGLKFFYQEAICGIINQKKVLKIIRISHMEALGLGGSRGILGASAAIGGLLQGDHTYEAITYRLRRNRGKPRKVDENSVLRMDQKTQPFTFSNFDPETGRILITPRGPDPLLFGVRGESPKVVKNALGMIKTGEEIERWVVFRTNQGTDAHLLRKYKISETRPFMPVIVAGKVTGEPLTIIGGHVIFKLGDETGEVNCAAYAPTCSFRKIVRELTFNDEVMVFGGVRKASRIHPQIINIEKIRVLKLADKVQYVNPACPRCNKRMGSMGVNKGFRCKKCGLRKAGLDKVIVKLPRQLTPGLYITPPSANRHLTKPAIRYGQEKSGVCSFRERSLVDFYELRTRITV